MLSCRVVDYHLFSCIVFRGKTYAFAKVTQLHFMIRISQQNRRVEGSQGSILFSAKRLFRYGKSRRSRV